MVDIGEDMAAKPKKDPLAALMALPGVGKATAKKLSDAGIKSSSGIVKAGQKGLIKAGLSAMISKKLIAAVSKKATTKKPATEKSPAKKTASKAVSKAKSTAKKAATKAKGAAKNAASKATASGRKVAEKTAKSSGDNRVKSSKSDDGRKGKTLNIPRNLKDMPWFRKKQLLIPLDCKTSSDTIATCQGASMGSCARQLNFPSSPIVLVAAVVNTVQQKAMRATW